MIVTIHQPNYLPYLGFFDKMADADIFILYDNTQYKSDDFQNRNKIRTSNDKGWMWLTIPLSYSFGTLIKEVKIADQRWRKTHWKSIEANYSRAPFFVLYKDKFKNIYDMEWEYLVDFNIEIIKTVRDCLGLDTVLIRSSELLPVLKNKSTQALVDLCVAANADRYISGADGEHYLELEKFKRENIRVSIQKYNHPVYGQAFSGFEPYMCILDLLFNHGPNSLKILKNSSNPIVG